MCWFRGKAISAGDYVHWPPKVFFSFPFNALGETGAIPPEGGGANFKSEKRWIAAAVLPTKRRRFAFGEGGRMKEDSEESEDRALRTVQKMLDVLESKIDSDLKCSVGDFIRLLQLERELKAEHVKEIQVTWQETKKQED
jgi:hypothetical protein